MVVGGVQADIMVSELLGSFGDNELSPECLDGAQAFLHGASTIGLDRWQELTALLHRRRLTVSIRVVCIVCG